MLCVWDLLLRFMTEQETLSTPPTITSRTIHCTLRGWQKFKLWGDIVKENSHNFDSQPKTPGWALQHATKANPLFLPTEALCGISPSPCLWSVAEERGGCMNRDRNLAINLEPANALKQATAEKRAEIFLHVRLNLQSASKIIQWVVHQNCTLREKLGTLHIEIRPPS